MSTTETGPDAAAMIAAREAQDARASAQDPADILVAREERTAKLKAALRAMAGIEQQVLIRHESFGIALSQVAAALGIDAAAAAQHLDRARAVLRTHAGV